MTVQNCRYCQEPIEGRKDKQFCSPYCKSAYHYQKQQAEDPLFKQIDKQLKTNRRLLKNFNKAGKSTIRKSTLLAEGFNPRYFTHYWRNDLGQLYLFCYDYGFMEKQETRAMKYVLVQWQPYMKSPGYF
jgi:hypothetical protein